jgi:hypothetical protein
MNTIDRRRYEMLVRVRDFGEQYGHLFPASSVARERLEAVAEAIAELDAQALTHMTASASALVERKRIARDALVARLRRIAHTARVLATGAPGLGREFEVPTDASDQRLLTTGRKFARDVEPFSRQFLAHGMPATFVADLNALVDSFERARHDQGLGREARHAARASTHAAVSSGMAAVRSLNAVVVNHLGDDAVTSTVWNRERRIVYPKQSGATPGPAPAPAARESPTGTKAA